MTLPSTSAFIYTSLHVQASSSRGITTSIPFGQASPVISYHISSVALTLTYPSYGAILSMDTEPYWYVLFCLSSLPFLNLAYCPGLLGMTDVELTAFEADIVATCEEYLQSHRMDHAFHACVTIESKESKYFIKFNHPETLWPEFSTQSYIHASWGWATHSPGSALLRSCQMESIPRNGTHRAYPSFPYYKPR